MELTMQRSSSGPAPFFQRTLRRLRNLDLYLFPARRDTLIRLNAIEDAFATLATQTPIHDHSAALNGQAARQQIVEKLFTSQAIRMIVETGANKGDTTAFFAEFGIPVHSCELSPAFFYVAKQRLAPWRNVNLHLCDSRKMLVTLAAGNGAKELSLFYLDAHWYADLPLRDEIRTIQEHWKDFIVLIDDFEVPGDEGYGYDRYGKTRLSLDYIADLVTAAGIDIYFPSVRARDDTGARRGYVFLSAGAGTKLLAAHESLNEHRVEDRNNGRVASSSRPLRSFFGLASATSAPRR
jgi:hypothetical protein